MGSWISLLLGMLYPPNAMQAMSDMYPGTPSWSPDTGIPDLSGKVIIITGATAGIGRTCALELARHGAKVYVCARTLQKGLEAVDAINNAEGVAGRAEVLLLHLEELRSGVGDAVQDFLKREERLDVLINCAATMLPDAGCTPEGIEMHFATNVLGHYALTRQLLPILKRTAASAPDGMVRVVNIASQGVAFAPPGGFDLAKLVHRSLFTFGLYGQSKLGNTVFANELARRYTKDGVLSVSVNPGSVQTKIWDAYTSYFIAKIMQKFPTEWGALTPLYAAASPEVTLADAGGWFRPWAQRGRHLRSEAVDPVLGRKLWEWSEVRMREAGLEVAAA